VIDEEPYRSYEGGIAEEDPLSGAVKQLFGLEYLFPYQRLVMANILEAAEAAGVPLCWPCPGESGVLGESGGSFAPPDDAPFEGEAAGEGRGRQMVILPTGAGKSLCFQLPAMLMRGPTLVVYPILSLMADQERRLRERGFSPVMLRGGQTPEERDALWNALRPGQSRIIIANPETLLVPGVLNRLKRIRIVHIVIDEAHCVSEWGESFRPGYLELRRIIEALGPPLVTAFTATAGAPVLEKINRIIFGEVPAHQITGNPDRANITYAAQGCVVRDLAVRDLLAVNARPAIVFCSSRAGTEDLAAYLRNDLRAMGKSWHAEIRFYHAGLSREEKAETEQWFMNTGEGVLCATCAYGMGVDKADIRTVIHRDCAPSVEAYLQEAGRAGRDGGQAKAVLLWGPDDRMSLARAQNEAGRKRLGALLDYARDAGKCRRQALLDMLDYEGGGACPETLCCDVCENKAGSLLREEVSMVDFFRRNKRRYTLREAAAVLANAEHIRWSEEDARGTIAYFLKAGRLTESRNIFWKKKLELSGSSLAPGQLRYKTPPVSGLSPALF
jgi:ATP-dependent DNA helicase RecQ